MGNHENVQIDKIVFNLDELSEERYNEKESVMEAEEILNQKRSEGALIKGSFEDYRWIFSHHMIAGRRNSIYFKSLDAIRFNKEIDLRALTVMMKCWACTLLKKYYSTTAKDMVRYLYEIIEVSNGFHPSDIDKLYNYLVNDEKGNTLKFCIVACVLNFLDFTDLDIHPMYIKKLMEFKSGLKLDSKTRPLPSAKEVLDFSATLEKFLVECQLESEIIYYYPLLLWWRVTTIIPLRPSEFCQIKRDALILNEDGKFILHLPRRKKRYIHRKIQIVDKIEVTPEIADLIRNYIDLTDKYGHTETLCSYRSLYYDKASLMRKRVADNFDLGTLSQILEKFYAEIMETKYAIPYEKRIRPGDTRHIAFCSLLLQGYGGVEIARLGGHTSVETQYHYSRHPEYYVALQVKNLMENYKLKIKNNMDKVDNDITSGILPRLITDKAYHLPKSDVRLKLREVGYCTDEHQRCQSTEHMLCEYWWASPQEIFEKKELILKKLNALQDDITELSAFLYNLQQKLNLEDFSLMNPHMNTQFKIAGITINEKIHQIAKIQAYSEELMVV